MQLPIFDFWGAVSNATADAVLVEVNTVNEWPGQIVYSGPPTTERFPIVVQPGETYYLAISYRRGSNTSERTIWGPYEAGKLIAGGLSPDAAKKLKEDLEAIIRDNDGAEGLAEVLLETILNEQDSLEREAAERLEADTGTLIEARKYSDGIADWAEIIFYTRAQTDAGMASTLQVARAYTDAFKSEAGLTFSTKAEREGGDAIAVQQSKAYTDDFKSQASFIYATNAAMGAANAATLSTAQSYADGVTATALNTVYTKAQTDAGFSSTLQAAKAHTDALGSFAALNYGTKTELNGVSTQAGLALSTAVGADNKAKAKIGLVTQVGNLITGIESENDGVTGSVKILSSIFQLLSTSSSDRADFADGVWYFYEGANTARAMVGRPFGGAHKLILWCGPGSIAVGAESKDNAFVYVSMTTTGGPRFGGSDVPTGGGGGGSGVIAWSGSGSSASAPAKTLPSGTLLKDLFFSVGGGSITTASFVTVSVGVYANSTLIQTQSVQVNSNGLQYPDGSFGADETTFNIADRPCPASGQVQFSIQILSVSGGSFRQAARMSGQVFAVLPI